MRILTVCILLTLISLPAMAKCQSDSFNQFDFWLGSWRVFAEGQLAGLNHISKDLNNCVIREHYKTDNGYEGRSFNIYDAKRDLWHQTWVDNTGLLLVLEGRFQQGNMQLSGEGITDKGEKVLHRITWTPNMEDNTVRQHWQYSKDMGQSWSSLFDGRYKKISDTAK
ncbi:hypothetical protein [Lacimicrobium alkaliphilum]|uniref:DUF1579 domain-containing protein n=1 Tax=Lacimicrobium alkaliphilum TaxID=1526571 RepID=A0A0U2RIC2_9ALTE|nr:hypothetical protein [Lacimicrobium alkaliphilum]ALS96954.1 hypothetical protein AT746_00775 [Lacimicrobium alkaliphilum]